MSVYELTLVLKESAAKDEAKIKAMAPGKVKSEKSWGVKDLAYPIKREQRGYYHFFEIELDPKEVSAADKALKQNETVLRYLLIRG
jgi:small subunit ribosomal protein S6